MIILHNLCYLLALGCVLWRMTLNYRYCCNKWHTNEHTATFTEKLEIKVVFCQMKVDDNTVHLNPETTDGWIHWAFRGVCYKSFNNYRKTRTLQEILWINYFAIYHLRTLTKPLQNNTMSRCRKSAETVQGSFKIYIFHPENVFSFVVCFSNEGMFPVLVELMPNQHIYWFLYRYAVISL